MRGSLNGEASSKEEGKLISLDQNEKVCKMRASLVGKEWRGFVKKIFLTNA